VSIHNFFEQPYSLNAAKLPWLPENGGYDNAPPTLLAANYRHLREETLHFSHGLMLHPYETLTVLFKKPAGVGE
jgi:hypothetical protein